MNLLYQLIQGNSSYINCNILIPTECDNEFYYEYKRYKISLCTENILLNTDSIIYIYSPVKKEIDIEQFETRGTHTKITKSIFRIKLVNDIILFLLEEEYYKFKEIANG